MFDDAAFEQFREELTDERLDELSDEAVRTLVGVAVREHSMKEGARALGELYRAATEAKGRDSIYPRVLCAAALFGAFVHVPEDREPVIRLAAFTGTFMDDVLKQEAER
jgi:hypothetical protein